MTIFDNIGNYFKTRFKFGNEDSSIYSPSACYPVQFNNSIYTPSGNMISVNNFPNNTNIFDPNAFNLLPDINNTFFNYTPVNFDMFTYRGFNGVSLSSEKTEKCSYTLDFWKKQGYNEEKGKLLAKSAEAGALRNPTKKCTKYVRLAVNRALKTGYTAFGENAYEVGKKILKNDKNFKKVMVDMSKIDSLDIPAGAIVIYPSRGYSKNKAGHIEISDGHGCGISDFKSQKLCYNHNIRKNPAEIWIPV